jgi:HTH-type transcriptional regulator/antitoxin HigA
MKSGNLTRVKRKGKSNSVTPSAVDVLYFSLVNEFPLRPFRNEDDCNRATEIIGRLADRGEEDLSPGETDYLDVLSTLMEQWENEHVVIAEPRSTADAVRAFMVARGLTQTDVVKGAGVSASTISELLSGKRKLGKQPASKLAKFFRMPVSVFLN